MTSFQQPYRETSHEFLMAVSRMPTSNRTELLAHSGPGLSVVAPRNADSARAR